MAISMRKLGPGLLFASAAVGTSHLVQSTRAGADYGFGLLIFFFLIPLVKYPGIRFGNDYAAATGKTLIHSYQSLGKWALGAYAIVVVLTLCFITAALGLVVTGMVKATVTLDFADTTTAAAILAVTALILMSGKYRLLETLSKALVPLFATLTLCATILLAAKAEWRAVSFAIPAFSGAMLMYVVQLAGWLLTPMDASVSMSLWAREKRELAGDAYSAKDARFDFDFGYLISMLLAICFVIMGASVIFGTGLDLPRSSGAFATQLITLFSSVIGEWSYYFIAALALVVMYSTLLTVVDGNARNLETLGEIVSGKPIPHCYEVAVSIVALAGAGVLLLFMRSFAAFIDLTGALVFILGPVYAVLNHRAMTSSDIPEDHRPRRFLRIWSLCGIIIMSVVAIAYVYLRWIAA